MNILHRFMEKVQADSITGCHNWIVYIRPDGYGDKMFRISQQSVSLVVRGETW